MRSSEVGRPIPYLDDVALDFPDLTIVAGHIGYPWTIEMIALATKYPNVHIDTSADAAHRYPRELVEYMRGHGRRKVLFGSDYPMLTAKKALRHLDSLDLDQEATELFARHCRSASPAVRVCRARRVAPRCRWERAVFNSRFRTTNRAKRIRCRLPCRLANLRGRASPVQGGNRVRVGLFDLLALEFHGRSQFSGLHRQLLRQDGDLLDLLVAGEIGVHQRNLVIDVLDQRRAYPPRAAGFDARQGVSPRGWL